MKAISDEEFERRFDAGEDVMDYVDVDAATRPNLEKAGMSSPWTCRRGCSAASTAQQFASASTAKRS